MSRVIEKTIYKFDELSDKAKERAREWWRGCENQDFHTEFAYEDFERMGNILGIEFTQRQIKLMGGGVRHEPTIYYSGFCSQGDGACFEGSYSYAKGAEKKIKSETGDSEHELVRIAHELQVIQRRHFYRLEATVKHRGHYYHEFCTEIDVDGNNDRNCLGNDTTCEAVRELLRAFMKWMYRSLEREYEWRMADEQVDDAITGNEYEFNEDGRRV